MKIVLIGFMCSGKSRVGKVLAKKMGWSHFDTDDMIAKQVGTSIAEIINQQGEKEFRDIERKAISLISMSDNCVISTGGGVPMIDENMKELSRNAHIIWLQVSPEVVLKRAGNIKKRPLIDPANPLASIQKRLKDRIPFYAKATHKINTDNLSPEEVSDRILEMIPEIKK